MEDLAVFVRGANAANRAVLVHGPKGNKQKAASQLRLFLAFRALLSGARAVFFETRGHRHLRSRRHLQTTRFRPAAGETTKNA